jgi:hypothetical protein
MSRDVAHLQILLVAGPTALCLPGERTHTNHSAHLSSHSSSSRDLSLSISSKESMICFLVHGMPVFFF